MALGHQEVPKRLDECALAGTGRAGEADPKSRFGSGAVAIATIRSRGDVALGVDERIRDKLLPNLPVHRMPRLRWMPPRSRENKVCQRSAWMVA